MNKIFSVLILISGFFLAGCPDKVDPDKEIKFIAPAHFPAPIYNQEITPAGFKLGKRLFYDPILSIDSTISCGSCHQQKGAFAHIDHDLSHGVFNRLGKRNAPAIQNMAWQPSFFWDGGVLQLDLQPFGPIENPLEMDLPLNQAVHRLRRNSTYLTLFKDAFGITDSAQITAGLMGKAFGEFMKMLVSSSSKYDKYLLNEISLTSEEQAGLTIFKERCESCHKGVLLTDFSFRNNGIAVTQDSGRAHITLNPADLYTFRVPSLRNIEKTAPYMHDGRFATLNAVLNHYASGVQNTPNLDPLLNQGGTLGIPLSETEKTQIIAFLKTLTDTEFMSDTRFTEE
ncbi:MAG: cytochrome-c peroxidase [Bacteroidia bacterium]|nr:cytochrome-c peroxidase [Bacteroidia bacterium]